MKNLFVSVIVLFTLNVSFAGSFTGEKVEVIHSPDSRTCAFFTLVGVDDANPGFNITSSVGGRRWFAVDMTYNGYSEIMDMLMLAKISNKPVDVATDGNGELACGLHKVTVVKLP